MTDALTEFRSSLKELERDATLKKEGRRSLPPVDRPLLRSLLLSLGEVLETDPGGAGDLSGQVEHDIARARKCIGMLGGRWDTTLVGEMQLACTEHIQGVDPRYLAHPRFDFEYVVEARQIGLGGLEAELRLVAARVEAGDAGGLFENAAAVDRRPLPHRCLTRLPARLFVRSEQCGETHQPARQFLEIARQFLPEVFQWCGSHVQ